MKQFTKFISIIGLAVLFSSCSTLSEFIIVNNADAEIEEKQAQEIFKKQDNGDYVVFYK
jgi:hypothetical protein